MEKRQENGPLGEKLKTRATGLGIKTREQIGKRNQMNLI